MVKFDHVFAARFDLILVFRLTIYLHGWTHKKVCPYICKNFAHIFSIDNFVMHGVIIHWSPWWNVVTLQKGQSAVHLASMGGHTETLKVLIEKAPQLNLQDQVRCCEGTRAVMDQGSHDFLIDIGRLDPTPLCCETRTSGNHQVTTGAWGSCWHWKQSMLCDLILQWLVLS